MVLGAVRKVSKQISHTNPCYKPKDKHKAITLSTNDISKGQAINLLLADLEEGEKSVTDESQWISEDEMIAEFG